MCMCMYMYTCIASVCMCVCEREREIGLDVPATSAKFIATNFRPFSDFSVSIVSFFRVSC